MTILAELHRTAAKKQEAQYFMYEKPYLPFPAAVCTKVVPHAAFLVHRSLKKYGEHK